MIVTETNYAQTFTKKLKRLHHQIHHFSSGEQCLQLADEDLAHYEIVFIEMTLSDKDGFFTGKEIKQRLPNTVTILLTSGLSLKRVITAFRESLFDDYLPKQNALESSNLRDILARAERLVEARKAFMQEYQLNTTMRQQSVADFHSLLGKSEEFQDVLDFIDRIAPFDSNVLILGETGTGKGLVAKEIHKNSVRSQHPFIQINCGAIPLELMESELFGHIKGAFTGALDHKTGLFALADKGTVFLDEIGDLSLNLQVKLLEALEDKVIRPLGETRKVDIDVRILAATHQDLEEKVQKKQFREDLFHRLNVMRIVIPPLRERLEDLEELIRHFIRMKSRMNLNISGIDPKALEYLKSWAWPGNIRQLENVIERAMIWSENQFLSREDFIDDNVSLQKTNRNQEARSRTSINSFQGTEADHVKMRGLEGLSDFNNADTLWKSFTQNQYHLWMIENFDEVYKNYEKIVSDAVYITKGNFGFLQSQHDIDLKVKLLYVSASSYKKELLSVIFRFRRIHEQTSPLVNDMEKSIIQPVTKGLPDSYLFNLLYPLPKKDELITISQPLIIKALILRYAQAHASAYSLKTVFNQIMTLLTDSKLASHIEGLQKNGLDAMHSYLCNRELFSGVATQLRNQPDIIEKEIQNVFPEYIRPPFVKSTS